MVNNSTDFLIASRFHQEETVKDKLFSEKNWTPIRIYKQNQKSVSVEL